MNDQPHQHHQFEPHLYEPTYAKDQYYVDLHGKWSQKTAELLHPKGRGGVRSSSNDVDGGGWSTFNRGTPTTTPAVVGGAGQTQQHGSKSRSGAAGETQDLMATHLQSYQRALSGGGGATTTTTQGGTAGAASTSVSPLPRPQSSGNVGGGMPTFHPSRGGAQRAEVYSSTPPAVSHSPEITPTSAVRPRDGGVVGNSELFSTMSVEAYEAQRRRVAEKEQIQQVPTANKYDVFSLKPEAPPSTHAVSPVGTSEQQQHESEASSSSYRRAPPRDKYVSHTSDHFLGTTPILKMQMVQTKLAQIANHQGDLSTAELQGLLADVENILQQQAANAGTPSASPTRGGGGLSSTPASSPTAASRMTGLRLASSTSPPRVDTASSPIRCRPEPTTRESSNSPPRRRMTPEKQKRTSTPPRSATSTTTATSPLKVVDSFSQHVPSPHKEQSAQTFHNHLMAANNTTSVSTTTTTSLPPMAPSPPHAPGLQQQPQDPAASNMSPDAALAQFWSTYAYYASAYQHYLHPGDGGVPQSHQQSSAALGYPLQGGGGQRGNAGGPAERSGSTGSSGVGWGNEAPVFTRSNPRTKHRPQTVSNSPPRARGSSSGTVGGEARGVRQSRTPLAGRKEQVRGRETGWNGPVLPVGDGAKEVEDFFEADVFDVKQSHDEECSSTGRRYDHHNDGNGGEGGWLDHPSPGRTYEQQYMAANLGPGEMSMTGRGRGTAPTLMPKYAQPTAAARSRSAQRHFDREKRAELVRVKAEEAQRMEQDYQRRQRRRTVVSEDTREYMKNLPRWQ